MTSMDYDVDSMSGLMPVSTGSGGCSVEAAGSRGEGGASILCWHPGWPLAPPPPHAPPRQTRPPASSNDSGHVQAIREGRMWVLTGPLMLRGCAWGGGEGGPLTGAVWLSVLSLP